jgi:prepilin-type N-terminal cleavage/methylation domain-containing protein/prepilin-type processing-associated H-X9-DG protein
MQHGDRIKVTEILKTDMKLKKAFTLVELLVVIAIIALLLSILMPSLAKAREQARRIVCANNVKTIGVADQIYAQESRDWHVPALNGLSPSNPIWFQNSLFVNIMAMKGRRNTEQQQGYYAQTLPKEYKCPSDKRSIDKGLNKQGNVISGTSYGMNEMTIRPAPGQGWYYYLGTTPGACHALRMTQVVNPAAKFFFMDAQWFVVYRDAANYLLYWDKYKDMMGAYAWDAPSYRHSEGCNMLYYDGHSAFLRKQEVFKLAAGRVKEQLAANNVMWQPIPGKDYMDPPR